MTKNILEKIDKFAEDKDYNLSYEINNACKSWTEAGGKYCQDAATLAKIDDLDTKISALETKLDATLAQLQNNKNIYLKIIKTQEQTIERLLSTLPNTT